MLAPKKGPHRLELPPRSLPSARATVLLGLLRVNAHDTPVEFNPDLPLEIAHLLLIDRLPAPIWLMSHHLDNEVEPPAKWRSSSMPARRRRNSELVRLRGRARALVMVRSIRPGR